MNNLSQASQSVDWNPRSSEYEEGILLHLTAKSNSLGSGLENRVGIYHFAISLWPIQREV
jgi:hypothetical protein